MKKIKLFCIPYAGGSGTVYLKWKKYLDERIELVPIELRGRGTKANEKIRDDITYIVDDVYLTIKEQTKEYEYAIFGHSMGSTIAYEVVQQIQKHMLKLPLHIFFSGRYPPQFSSIKNISSLPDDEFENEIIKLGGTPKEIFKSTELKNYFLPIIRTDYKLLEAYKYNYDNQKIKCNISVFFGTKDNYCDIHKLRLWNNYTTCSTCFNAFEGNHFFILQNANEVVKQINNTLIKYI